MDSLQQQQNYGGYYGNTYGYVDDEQRNFNIYQLEMQDFLDEFEHSLKCEVWKGKIAGWQRPEGIRPLLNDKGISFIRTQLALRCHKGVTLSKLGDWQITNMAVSVCTSFIDAIEMGAYMDFDIDEKYLSIVVDMIFDNVISTLNRAKEGFTVDSIKTTYKSVEQFTQREQPQNTGGLFSIFKRKKNEGS